MLTVVLLVSEVHKTMHVDFLAYQKNMLLVRQYSLTTGIHIGDHKGLTTSKERKKCL